MSVFGGLDFFIYLFLFIIPAIILGIMEKPLKQYSLVASLAFIYLIFRGEPLQLLYLAIFYVIELHTIKLYLFLRRKYGKSSIIYAHAVIFSVLPLALYKLTNISGGNLFGFLGISYMTFRVVQIIIETYDGLITEMSAFEITSFLLFFPTISAGPIDRSRRFTKDLSAEYSRTDYLVLLGCGLKKILLGACYKFVFSAIMFTFVEKLAERYTPPLIIAYAYCYGIYMFFDFAGYSLMAIGVSYIFGIQTPDNFNKPFASIDIKDFWNRWHISLSLWFRDFIFSRFMMQSMRKKWFKTRLNTASVGFIVNMVIMGVWHGLTSYYICYGIYHGLLLAGTEIYQKKSKFYAANKKKLWYKTLSWFITLNAVMFGFLIFSGRVAGIFSVAIQQIFLS